MAPLGAGPFRGLTTRIQRRPAIAIFLIGATLLGIICALSLPAESGYDEEDHFLRAYQVSQGKILGEERGDQVGGVVPADYAARASIPKAFKAVRARPHFYDFHDFWRPDGSTGPPQFVDFRNTAIYSPIPYLPSAAAVLLSRGLGISATGAFYLARLLQLLTFIVLVVAASCLFRPAAAVFLTIGLLPTAIAQAATISADPVTTGLVLLMLASILAGLKKPRPLWEATALAVAVALCKPVYVVLAVGYLLPRPGSGRRWSPKGALPLVVGGLTAVGWTKFADRIFLPLRFLIGQGPIEPSRQLASLENHPWRIFAVVWHTLQSQGWFIGRSIFANMTRADYHIPGALMLCLPILLLLSAVAARTDRLTLPIPFRAVLVVVALVEVALLVATSYLRFTEYGSRVVQGLQGRYLLPVLPVLAVALALRRRAASAPRSVEPAAIVAATLAVSAVGIAIALG